MTPVTPRTKTLRRLVSVVLASAGALIPAGCSSSGDSQPAEAVEIDSATPAGEKARWIVGILNADDDTTVAQWESELHDTFLAEVSAEDLVDLLNTNIRPAAPYTVTAFDSSGAQSVTTLESDVVDPMDMSVSLDDAGQIVGLWFGPTSAD